MARAVATRTRQPKEDVIRVRVDEETQRRTEAAARRKKLDVSSYVRMVLVERLDADDASREGLRK